MYLQRQISAFVGNNSYTDPVRYSIADRVWTSQDVYPAKIQVIGDGTLVSNEMILVASTGFATMILPEKTTDASRISFFMRTTQNVRVTVNKLLGATSVTLVRAGIASDSNGMFSFTGFVNVTGGNTILVENISASSAIIEYFCWIYPPDISVASAWRDGAQTIGTAPTQ